MPNVDIDKNIYKAIEYLFEKDAILLVNDSSERSITHKFASYLEKYFPEWDVDCEYNRDLINTKKLKDICKHSSDEDGSSVFPDIIIHKRMSKENYIVIEVKKTTNKKPDKCDIQKLEAFKNELGYQHGLFIRFITGSTDDIGVKTYEWIDKY